MSIGDLFWLFFMFSAIQPMLRQRDARGNAGAQDFATRTGAKIAGDSAGAPARDHAVTGFPIEARRTTFESLSRFERAIGKPSNRHGLLPVHQQNHPRFSLPFECESAHPHCLEHALAQHWLDRREHEE